MKSLLLGLLLSLTGVAHAQFNGTSNGFGVNVPYVIEHGTFALTGPWDFSSSPGFVLPPGVDTNAQTECSGIESLRGDGTCVVPMSSTGTISGGLIVEDYIIGGGTFAVDSSSFQVGTTDSFGRYQVWYAKDNNVLRLGASQVDSDGLDSVSEGIVVYARNNAGNPMDATNAGLGRIKSNRFALVDINAGVVVTMFRVDGGNLELNNDSGDRTFNIDRLTGNTTIFGALQVNDILNLGAKTSVELRGLACTTYATERCTVYNTDDNDIYTSTGSAIGQWRNMRLGIGP